MHFGAGMFFTDHSATPAGLAAAMEAHGFESLWAAEHSHIPLSRKSPWGGGGDLPKKYYDAMDPFVTLTAAACATSTLKVATGVCLVQQRDAIQTAKLVASIDQISNGRFLFGVGIGWNRDEMENHGVTFETRAKLAREKIEAMKAIWAQPAAEYHGEFINFEPMVAEPKPVQKPHPPIIVGGAFPHGARRALRYGDGWIPLSGRAAYGELSEYLPRFRQMASEFGRDLATIPLSMTAVLQEVDTLKRYADLGVSRVVFDLPSEPADKLLPMLDRWAEVMQQVNA